MLYHYCIVLLEVIDIDLLYILLSMYLKCSVQFSSVQCLSCVRLFSTPWITARQASLSITNSRSSLRLMSIESVMPSSHLILCCPQSLPASESFPMSQFVRCDMKNSYIKWKLEIKMLWDFPGKCTGMGSHFLFQYI